MSGHFTFNILSTALLALALPCLGADAGPSVAERVAAIEQRLEGFADGHVKALHTLAESNDLEKGIETFQQQAEKLKAGLRDTGGGRDLAAEARELTTELMKKVPGGSLDAPTAEQLDREALATARRAEALDGRISAIVKALEQSLSLTPQWAATFKAFSFDPKRQDEIVRGLVGKRLQELQGQDTPPAPLADKTGKQGQIPADRSNEAKSATPIVEQLISALAWALNTPGNEQALGRLNAVSFEMLHSRGPKILQPPAIPRFTPTEIANLEAAAKMQAPAALQLLAMMDITGRGQGLNSQRGVSLLKEAGSKLSKYPGMPFGPGIEKAAEPGAISGVGTVNFWLAECSLVGVTERDLGKACVYYALAVHAGDGRAAQRLRQLADLGLITREDANRWTHPPTTPFFRGALGLVELKNVSLTSLYAKELRQRPLPRHAVAAPPDDPAPANAPSGRAYLGIDVGSAPRGYAGVVAETVLIGSPADLADLRPRDLITDFGDQPIGDVAEMRAALEGSQPGRQVMIKGRRYHGGDFSLSVTLGTAVPLTRSIECVKELIHVDTRINPEGEGIRVNYVTHGSHPDVEGLHSGDVVVAVAGEPVRQFDQLASALQSHNGTLKVSVWRPAQGLDSSPVPVEISLGY